MLGFGAKQAKQPEKFTSAHSDDLDWSLLNKLFNLGFKEAKEYTPKIKLYTGDKKWQFWKDGVEVDFPEGIVNVMRLVDMVLKVYGKVDFKPVIGLLEQLEKIFDIVIHIEDHKDDTIGTILDLLDGGLTAMKESKLPFVTDVVDVIHKLLGVFKPFRSKKIGGIITLVFVAVEKLFGSSITKIAEDILKLFKTGIAAIKLSMEMLDYMQNGFVGKVVKVIFGDIQKTAEEMIKADTNHKGTKMKVQHVFKHNEWLAL